MNYLQAWEQGHFRKIARELVDAGIEITLENVDRIMVHTSFEKRSQRKKSECPYYEQNQPCHDIDDLNCLLCPCPNYDSRTDRGGCKINSNYGKITKHKNLPEGEIWDCSDCSVGHSPKVVKNWLELNINYLASFAQKDMN